VQVGTNLSMVRLAAAAELWLGKPVIAINTATYWHALRQNQIADKIAGLGRLLEEFDVSMFAWTRGARPGLSQIKKCPERDVLHKGRDHA